MRVARLTAPLVLITLLAGCGGGDAPEAEEAAPAEAEPMAVQEPLGSASISGMVRFEGTAPERQPIRQARECAELHEEPVLTDNVVVGDDGALRWVFVYVKEGLGDHTFQTPSEPVVLDQEDCMYTPHVFGVQTGQTIRILNSDPLAHNIHALPEANRPFNVGMPNEGDVREREFREPEVMVRIKCDIHPWMLAWAGVLEHPYHSVSGEDGAFSLDGLPAGEYVIEAWHEEYGTQTQTVTVGDGEAQNIEFTFSAAAS